ncbi:MAG: hypoxanthine phosphoribosyltransferase, partial [Oscillospiraceae bacterium]|nr:hypoxanthine phosphoribosyltransferase [Oscillospiraceae bacterium]
GAAEFFSDLLRAVEWPVTIDFIRTASYSGTESTGNVEVDMMKVGDVSGRDVVIVEDICDTGRSLVEMCRTIGGMQPRSLKTVCLLDKPSRRVVEFKPDYTGFEIEDVYVIGNGFDCDNKFRNLPYIGVYKQS